MSAERNPEALPESIDLAGEDVIYLKEALQMLPSGVKISESRFRQWCKNGRYGLKAAVFGGRLMVVKSSIPRVLPLE